jgi:glutamate dehydrogenase (NADP+)
MPARDIDDFMNRLVEHNPGQPEFHQAAREFVETVWDVAQGDARYRSTKVLDRMVEPDRVVLFRVAWEGDDGEVHVNKGYRVQFNSAIGPYKGGLRFHPSVNLGVLKFLGFEQIFKNALTGLPMGGGKGGSNFDPKGRTDREVMRFCQSFMTELHRHIGPDTDVPAGDIGVGSREIGYLFGQYSRLANEWTGTLTGKGLAYGGSRIRPEATGYGVVYFTKRMLERVGRSCEGLSCVVSGSGNVAQYTVEKLNDLGAKVVTLSDSGGFVHDPDGIDAGKLAWVMELKNERRGRISEYVDEYPSATYHEGKAPWGVECDWAFPCATQNELEEADAKKLVKNGVLGVTEGANMPCTLEAIHHFQAKGVLFGPAKAANAGGVGVSGLEMAQNSQRVSWSRSEVDERLRGIMDDIHQRCVHEGVDGEGKVDYVRGANVAGFRKVADAMVAYGVM